MSDWELSSASTSNNQEMNPNDSEWSLSAPESQESLSQSAMYAIPRIGEDVAKSLYQGAQQIPEYYKKAKTEVPGALNSLLEHPNRAARQFGAGITELGHNLINTPKGLADYASNRLNLLPKEYANKVPYQRDISEEINQLFGKAENPGESLIRGAGRNSINLLGAGKLASTLNPMKLTYKSMANDILKTREKNINAYGEKYGNLWKEAENKGFGDDLYNVDIDMPTIKKYSPGKGIKGILDFDRDPTLQNAHAAKSDLLRIQRDLNKLPTLRTAERQQLHAVDNAINSINKNMFVESNGKINEPILNKYQGIQEGYKNEVVPYRNKAINEFMRGESSPKEMINSLSKKSFAAKRGQHHKAMQYRKMIKPIAKGLGGIGATGALYNYLFGHNS